MEDSNGVLDIGEFRLREVNANTVIDFNTDADAAIEMQIVVQNVLNMTIDDLIL